MSDDDGARNHDKADAELARIWRHVVEGARRDLGRECVDQWVRPIRLKSIINDLATLTAATNFLADWVERNYGLSLLRHLQLASPGVRRLTVIVESRDDEAWDQAPLPVAAAVAPVPHAPAYLPQGQSSDIANSAPLDTRFTFANFVVGRPNELAHAAARRVAETADASFNPVFLHGGVGLGKTHLMHAIAWQLHQTKPQCKVLYLSAEQFMYKFVQSLRFRDVISFKQQFRSVDVLMIDDVQFIAGKDSTQEEFFHTFNTLIDLNRQIVISADRSPERIDGLEERICSRLQWGLVVDIHPADYELRLGILQSKAEILAQSEPGFQIEPKVLEFLAHRINSNVRVLEGALTRLFAFSSLVGRRITLEMTQECLADLLRLTDRKVTIDEIKRKVADHYTLKLNDLISARRSRAVARPRQVAMFLAKSLTAKSLPEIGRAFGGRDHTTVIHAVKKIEELTAIDANLAEDVELLRRMLEG